MLKPINDRIVVEVEPPVTVTASGLTLPNSQNAMRRGLVLAVGEGHITSTGEVRPLTVKEGDTVIFTNRTGVEVEDLKRDDYKIFVLREDELLGILEAESK